jgi:hypothetical protein
MMYMLTAIADARVNVIPTAPPNSETFADKS